MSFDSKNAPVVKRGNEILNVTFFISSATYASAKRVSNFFHYYSKYLIQSATLELTAPPRIVPHH